MMPPNMKPNTGELRKPLPEEKGMKIHDQKSSSISPNQGENKKNEKRALKSLFQERNSFSDLLERRTAKGDEYQKDLRQGRVQVADRESSAQNKERQGREDSPSSPFAVERGSSIHEVQSGLGEAGNSVVESSTSKSSAEFLQHFDSSSLTAGENQKPPFIAAPPTIETSALTPPAALEEITKEILTALHVGEDQQARKVIFLDIQIPGHGDLRVRLRREGGGLEVRFRADNDALARMMRQHSESLRGQAKAKGLHLTSIEVVR